MRIAQITDAHILEKGKHWFSEPATATADRLGRAVDFLNRLQPALDVVLFTGDLSEDGCDASYEHLLELLQPLKIPLFVIPGNHDRREALRSAFQKADYLPKRGYLHYVIDLYPVRLIGLDTVIEGEGGGRLCPQRLHWLEETLRQDSKKPTFLFMHHPPGLIRTGTKLFDRALCDVPLDWGQWLQLHPQILGIFSGHYHSLCVSHFAEKTCWIAPSLSPSQCIHNPREDEEIAALDLTPPAVTLHEWFGGKTWASHVYFLADEPRRLDWQTLCKKH